MESNNSPAHDFAPAWLKLPAPLNKGSVERSIARLDNSSTRKELSAANSTPDAQRFNSHHSSHYLSSRHLSLGNEEQYHSFNGQSNANVNGGRFSRSKNTEFTTARRANFRHERDYREKSVPTHHSTSRSTNRNNAESKALFLTPKRTPNDKSTANDKSEGRKKLTTNEENCNVFNQEFPSLVDDYSIKNNGSNVANTAINSSNAWSNSAAKSKVLSTSKNKVQLIQRSVSNFDNNDGANKSDANAIINSKIVTRNLSLMSKSKAGFIKDTNYSNFFGQNSKLLPVFAKTNSQTTTPAMEILVKNPKMRGNKSNFLKSMRNKDIKTEEITADNVLNDKMKRNGIDSENELESNESCFDNCDVEAKRRISDACLEDINQNDNFGDNLYEHEDEELEANMSSSLEAEHRFLLELGWKEDDDPSYAPLTEDEVNEFKDLINARHIANGLKRNTLLNNQAIHLNMSPKKPSLTSFAGPNVRANNADDESSSSSEEDE